MTVHVKQHSMLLCRFFYGFELLVGELCSFHIVLLLVSPMQQEQQEQSPLLWKITLKILEFVLNSTEKVKPGFLLSLMCVFSQSGQNPNLTAFTSKILVFCRPEWAKEGTPWKWILTIFKWKNEFPKQLGSESRWKK